MLFFIMSLWRVPSLGAFRASAAPLQALADFALFPCVKHVRDVRHDRRR
jgi:hypothetical protein